MKPKQRTCLLLVTETELCRWGEVLSWPIPRAAVSANVARKCPEAIFKGAGNVIAADRKEDWLLAEVAPTSPRLKAFAPVPFNRVVALYGFGQRQSGILKSRFGDLGCRIEKAIDPLEAAFETWLRSVKSAATRKDIEDGIAAFPELFIEDCGDGGMLKAEDIVAAVLNFEGGERGASFIEQLVSYSRESPFPCTGLCAGLCDLGRILRSRQTTDSDSKAVSSLSESVAAMIRARQNVGIAEISDLLGRFQPAPEYGVENAMFLSWKYAAEAKGGEIDYAMIQKDVDEAIASHIPPGKISDALKLFGGLSGFKAFSCSYHRIMRDRAKRGGNA